MLKKYVGGLTLLIFTFTFVVPLLIGVNTADAGPTIVIKQRWMTEFVCPDGTYATESSGTHESESYSNHPEPRYGWVRIGGGDDNPNNDVMRLLPFHRDHETTEINNPTLDYTKVTIQPDNPVYCQDDGEDEETTN